MKMRHSRFWLPLWAEYPTAPSIVICRVPELEYASTLDVSVRTLDHCCGDGIFASLAWPGRRLQAGCDLSELSVRQALARGAHGRVDACDASRALPYQDGAFDLVFNNSALEHIPDLVATLSEASRVLVPGGTFAFNVLNRRFYEWWPMAGRSAQEYRDWQPFYHAYSLQEWEQKLGNAGLRITSVDGYLDRRAARALARLDYAFSGAYLADRKSTIVSLVRRHPRWMSFLLRSGLGGLRWKTKPDAGAGYFIQAVRERR